MLGSKNKGADQTLQMSRLVSTLFFTYAYSRFSHEKTKMVMDITNIMSCKANVL